MTFGKVEAWRGEIIPERRGNIAERTTSKFEARTDGWAPSFSFSKSQLGLNRFFTLIYSGHIYTLLAKKTENSATLYEGHSKSFEPG
jgi:hypothetical protein